MNSGNNAAEAMLSDASIQGLRGNGTEGQTPPVPTSRLFTKGFSAIVSAQLFSLLGEAILKFVLPLYLLNLSGSATLYGIVVACAFIPYILMTPLGALWRIE